MSTLSGTSARPPPTATLRRWHARMHDDHGWLRTFLTFSFAGHYDAAWSDFGPLRVINEDRISAGTGFPTHAHARFEIFSYVLGGELTHRDSMGNVETLKRGEIQYTRAGTGIRHSEFNVQKEGDTHFMQIWFKPDLDKQSVSPAYFSTQTPEALKRDKLITLIKPHAACGPDEAERTGLLPPGAAIPAHASIAVRASILTRRGSAVEHVWGTDTGAQQGGQGDDGDAQRWGVVHLAMRSGYKDPDLPESKIKGEAAVKVTLAGREYTLGEGDSLFVKGARVGDKVQVESVGQMADTEAEFLLFDLKGE